MFWFCATMTTVQRPDFVCEALCDWQRFEIGSTNGMLAWYSDIVKQELPWVNARQKVWILQYWQTLIRIVWLDEFLTFVQIAWVYMACSGSWESPMRIEALRFHNTFYIILFPPGSSMRCQMDNQKISWHQWCLCTSRGIRNHESTEHLDLQAAALAWCGSQLHWTTGVSKLIFMGSTGTPN